MNTYDVFAVWEKRLTGERQTIFAEIDARTPNAAINKMKQFIRTGFSSKRGKLIEIVAHNPKEIPF